MPIVAVLPDHFAPWRFSFADHLVYDAGPAEFLGWMKGAAFVCTNSFHGTCFSLIYRKAFLGVPHVGTATRTVSLLKRLGLLTRLVDDSRGLESGDAIIDPIDYTLVEPRLQEAVGGSLDYLRRALA